MATTKKATTGKKPVAGASKGATKAAKVVATKTQTQTKAKSKATAKAAPAHKPAPGPKKAVAVTLNDRQREILQKVKDAGATGYSVAKGEQRTIDALAARKLLKKGARNKQTGNTPYLLTKAAANHLPAAAPAPAPAAAPASAPAVAAEPAPAPAPAPPQASAAAPAPTPAM